MTSAFRSKSTSSDAAIDPTTTTTTTPAAQQIATDPPSEASSVAGQEATSSSPRPFEEIPGPRGVYSWPILGYILIFKPFSKFPRTFYEVAESLFQHYGPIVRLKLGSPVVLTKGIRDMETIFRNEGMYPQRTSFGLAVAYAKRNKVKKNFNIVQGSEWHELRAPLTKRVGRVDSATHYMQGQNEVAEEFRDILENGSHLSPQEMNDAFFRFTSESIGLVCFNSRLGFFEPNFTSKPDILEYLQASQAVFRLMEDEIKGRSIMHRAYRNKTYREYEATQKTLKKCSEREVRKAAAKLKQMQQDGLLDPEEPNLLLSLLNDPSLDFDDVRILMNTLYVGGTESTAKTLQVLFYTLATNPDKQEILYREIMEVLGPDNSLTPETLARMSYLKAVLRESFRLHVPIKGISRIIPTDVVLSGYHVPAKTTVIMCTPQVSQSYFDKADQFLPERWLRTKDGSRAEGFIHPMASVPFGHGRRNCIGRRFAEQEIFVATVKILQKLKIGIKPESENMQFSYSLFIDPVRPIAFTFTRR